MEHTWRWFGPNDPITLEDIRQTDATGIVTALHHIPNGEVWPLDAILERKALIEASGLRWSVVESVPVHEHIKWGGPERARAIDRFAQTLRNLGHAGLDTVCYNFMPVLDWTRTDLEHPLPRGGRTLRFDYTAYAAFDLFILERPGAIADYGEGEVDQARAWFRSAGSAAHARLSNTILRGLPGSEESYDLDSLRTSLAAYAGMEGDELRDNLGAFLRQVAPVAEQVGIRLAIHPDDPPRSLFGLPRVVSTAEDLRWLLRAETSPANGVTMCVGSYGSSPHNDVVGMTREFAERIYFAHLRNVTVETDGKSFIEDSHIDGGSDMVAIIGALLREEQRRTAGASTTARIPMRPDHGHRLLDDLHRTTNPGYSLVGRLKGLAQLRGIEKALSATMAPTAREG
ncbi:mannonate dehydratase [Microbacterium aurantiacum]|uniref:Mannonate dehydratase n=1 Tax=Microbacterium aurantiacum TaxID=162393 RepID=A0ABT8FPE7_9MICO|nr:mannonate dehydratase [Microbacterium aurantiacum]MBN9201378.1 mannonate dehydratase [Microbacterium chocolatum]MDN4463208.1 mannonate dehydratase [Microbacterium aurantiacum]ODT12048.1 MAG: mannonate dehydratase [Microbacterium sp. SCN 70-18]